MSTNIIEIDEFILNNNNNNIKNYKTIETIDRLTCDNITYNIFFNNYMLNNVPVIIKDFNKNWQCQNWLDKKSNKINFDNIKNFIKNINVPIYNCKKNHYNSHEKNYIKFYDYLNYWENKINNENNLNNDELFYLKDWHLKLELPDYNFYNVPFIFLSDWLNEYLIENKEKDDYQFVYMGPQNTW